MKKIRYSSKMNALFALLIVLVLGIAFFFNAVTLVLSNRYPLSIDLNANAAYEIGEETRAMLEGLTEEVVIYVLATEDMFDGSAYTIQARSILNQYPKYSRYVTLQYGAPGRSHGQRRQGHERIGFAFAGQRIRGGGNQPSDRRFLAI